LNVNQRLRILRSAPALFLAFSLQAIAQAPASVAPLPTPEQVTHAKDAPLNPALPTVFLVGDSTCRNQADLGWGDHLAHYFDQSRINVANRAIAGRSTRTYMNEAWGKTLAEVKAGDFVLIQLGHNDGGTIDGAKPRGTLKGIGEESKEVTLADGSKEVVHTYGWYIRKYIADTRAKNATPILLTLTVRNIWTNGPDGKKHVERDMGYSEGLRQIAAAEKVPLLDMGTLEANELEKVGPQTAALLFPVDHTHTSAQGAEMNAGLVVRSILLSHLPLSNFLNLPDQLHRDPVPSKH
jgi:lysophospholipase L1-like esterase